MRRYCLICLMFFCFLASANAAQKVDLRAQLGIKKLPKTEKAVLQYTGSFLKHQFEPTWSGIDKKLVKKTFSAAFDKKGKIKPEWVKRYKRILKEMGAGTLSDPIPPQKKNQKWEFYIISQTTLITHFTVEPTDDPIKITSRAIMDRFPHR